ncbi:hypothetical protein GGR42_000937 [Saonia flava]|uniref:DUF3575 domain-containing protein n=1 Tax=Saonia flava TaxID=523696 RepID=A0A846QXV9_9FLAO|nr:DUF3575 domain-containing protein [Saonia flava]NJB70475.1 hypothetical protein [Saonia flava]
MKKVFIITFVALGFGLNSYAQENVIKINPLGLALGSAELGYERALNEKSALEVSLAYFSSDATFNSGEEVKANGFGAEGKYKLYFSSTNNAPRGWYAAPVATYASASADSSSGEDGKFSYFGAGAVAGYQWIFGGGNSGFALDLNLGFQYISASTQGSISGVSIDGILPRLGLSLGYAW